jgi:hypothetical protein
MVLKEESLSRPEKLRSTLPRNAAIRFSAAIISSKDPGQVGDRRGRVGKLRMGSDSSDGGVFGE